MHTKTSYIRMLVSATLGLTLTFAGPVSSGESPMKINELEFRL